MGRYRSARAGYVDLGVMAAAHGLSDGFNGLLAPILALVVAEFALSEFDAGLLLSLPGFSTFLLILPLSFLADASGRRVEILLAGLALAAGAYFSFLWAGTFGVLLALAFLARSGNAVFHPCGTAIVAARFPYRRAIAISVFGIAGNIGATATPLIQGIIANSAGWRLSVAAFAIPILLLLPVIRVRFPPLPRDRQRRSLSRRSVALIREVVRNRTVVALGVIYALTAIAAKSSIGFLPLLAVRRFGMSPAAIGLMVALYYASGIAFKAFAVAMYRRLGVRGALQIPLVLSVGAVLGMIVTPSETVLIVLAVVAGLANSISPIVLTATANSCEDSALTASVGLIYWLHSLWFAGPLLAGIVANRFGMDWVYVFAAGVFTIAVAATVTLKSSPPVVTG